jgi:hypothetical protein
MTLHEVQSVEHEDHDAAVARLLAARAEQGLASKITDPAALERAAALFATVTDKAARRSRS